MKEDELVTSFNNLCKNHLANGSLLKDLTNEELFIWIAGKTYKYGRSLKDSLENAKIHLKNRKKAEILFSRKKEVDLLGY